MGRSTRRFTCKPKVMRPNPRWVLLHVLKKGGKGKGKGKGIKGPGWSSRHGESSKGWHTWDGEVRGSTKKRVECRQSSGGMCRVGRNWCFLSLRMVASVSGTSKNWKWWLMKYVLFGSFLVLSNFYGLDLHNENCVALANLQ